MNKLLLENGLSYLVISECEYDNRKYLYLINENDDQDFKFMELLENSILTEVGDEYLLKKLIQIMLEYIYKIED